MICGEIETKEYLLRSGGWVPKARVWLVTPRRTFQDVYWDSDTSFATREEARAHSERLGQQAVNKMLF